MLHVGDVADGTAIVGAVASYIVTDAIGEDGIVETSRAARIPADLRPVWIVDLRGYRVQSVNCQTREKEREREREINQATAYAAPTDRLARRRKNR